MWWSEWLTHCLRRVRCLSVESVRTWSPQSCLNLRLWPHQEIFFMTELPSRPSLTTVKVGNHHWADLLAAKMCNNKEQLLPYSSYFSRSFLCRPSCWRYRGHILVVSGNVEVWKSTFKSTQLYTHAHCVLKTYLIMQWNLYETHVIVEPVFQVKTTVSYKKHT